jgi:hypothetical protein
MYNYTDMPHISSSKYLAVPSECMEKMTPKGQGFATNSCMYIHMYNETSSISQKEG